jgi:hypothetical protein
VREKPLPLRPGDDFYISRSGGVEAMSNKLDKMQPELNMLAAFASTMVVALAVGLPMAVVIIWVCS